MIIAILLSALSYAAETEKVVLDISIRKGGQARVIEVQAHKRPGYGVNIIFLSDIKDLSIGDRDIIERKALNAYYDIEAGVEAPVEVIDAKRSNKVAK